MKQKQSYKHEWKNTNMNEAKTHMNNKYFVNDEYIRKEKQ